jgi:cell division FtsZ-interacting protein ZapD
MIETSDMENKQEFLRLVSHSLEVLEDGLISETNRNSIKHGILETISKLYDQRDVAATERDNLRAALDDYQATINKWVDLCGTAEDRAKAAETRIGTLQALDISAQEIIRKLREDNRKYKAALKAIGRHWYVDAGGVC